MAYFLKKTVTKNRTYLAIYESFYDPKKKGTAHKSFRSLGSVETLQAGGMEDPIAYYQAEVDALNAARKEAGTRMISDISPMKHLGYFPLQAILRELGIQHYIDLYQYTTDFDFDLFSLLSSLVYARSVKPCSKRKTFHEVLPALFESTDFSYDQLLDGLAFFGNEYEKIIELFTHQVAEKYGYTLERTYFDCTNFYFEIDRQDDFRRKGASKERRQDPLVGMGLLLDAHQIPLSMKLYPGNRSERPVLREVIKELKERHGYSGRTIHVADKGLNCAENIFASVSEGDGYLFSKSVKMLPEKEKLWLLLDQDWTDVVGEDKKLRFRYKSCVEPFAYTLHQPDGSRRTITIDEKRVITFNPSLARKKRAEILKMVDKAQNMSLSQAKKSDFGEAGKYLTFHSQDREGKKTKKKAVVSLNQALIDQDLELAGYNLLVTSELGMEDLDIVSTYRNLWRIEESFRLMKSDLDARPVFLQKENSIKGHFLVCYLAVLLERIFQFKVLKSRFSSSQIYEMMRSFCVVKNRQGYINVTAKTPMLQELAQLLDLPLTHYFLSETKIKRVLNHRFKSVV